jgi:very-long-chain (3R)-3-hydroxyacyl-CoA dehydratase
VLEAKTLEFDNRRLWKRVETPLAIFQTLQLVEVLHCIVGLVPSNPIITFEQIVSRILVVWGVAWPFASSRASIGIFLITGSWSLAEVTRYLYYALNIVNLVPYSLTWCRYSFFLILYPSGVSGELLTIWASLAEIARNSALSFALPNSFNISFHYDLILMGIMLLYIPRKYTSLTLTLFALNPLPY